MEELWIKFHAKTIRLQKVRSEKPGNKLFVWVFRFWAPFIDLDNRQPPLLNLCPFPHPQHPQPPKETGEGYESLATPNRCAIFCWDKGDKLPLSFTPRPAELPAPHHLSPYLHCHWFFMGRDLAPVAENFLSINKVFDFIFVYNCEEYNSCFIHWKEISLF